jgi:hypothetical protein
MALIDCPECGKQVSSLAKACPTCGLPVRRHLQARESGEARAARKRKFAEFGRDLFAERDGQPRCPDCDGVGFFDGTDCTWCGYESGAQAE